MSPILYEETEEFEKDIKRLLKRFRTLRDDLGTAKRAAVEFFHKEPRIDNNAIEEIPGYCTDEIRMCKIRKFACRALKGRGVMSGIRVTYAYHVAGKKVVFIEMYFKGDKAREDSKRLKKYLSTK